VRQACVNQTTERLPATTAALLYWQWRARLSFERTDIPIATVG
jgi:hypothetical protein